MFAVRIGMTVSRAAVPFGEAEHLKCFSRPAPESIIDLIRGASLWLDYLVCKFSVGIAQSSGIAVSRVTRCRS